MADYSRTASAEVNLGPTIATGFSDTFRRVASAGVRLDAVVRSLRNGDVHATASAGVTIGSSASVAAIKSFSVAASSGVTLGVLASAISIGDRPASASAGVSLGAIARNSAERSFSVTASAPVSLSQVARSSGEIGASRSASAGFAVGVSASASSERSIASFASVTIGGAARAAYEKKSAASSGVALSVEARASREFHATASSHVSVGVHASSSRSFSVTASAGVSLYVSAVARKTATLASSVIRLGGVASAFILQVDGTVSPGGGNADGPRRLLLSGLHPEFPLSYAETPTITLASNGVDRMVAWSPHSRKARLAGVEAPLSGPILGGTGVGLITGERVAFVRFIDDLGRPSNLSPISNSVMFGRDGLIGGIQVDPETGTILVRSDDHGFTSPDYLVFSGVNGFETLNGIQHVTPATKDVLRVDSAKATSCAWPGGGQWTYGTSSAVYSSIPVPARPGIVARQILRNAEGNLDVLYADITTSDLLSTSLSSSRLDDSLTAQESVCVTDARGQQVANRRSPPPSHKSAIASFGSRVFAAADAEYKEGCVIAVQGGTVVTGVGTDWPDTFVGRLIYVEGFEPRTIVSLSGQEATVDAPMIGPSRPYQRYSILPPPGEALAIYYSEPGEPESWPETNAFSLPDDGDGDRITGLFTSGGYLYVVQERHVHRVVFQGSPESGATSFMVARRGAINNRCVVQVEDTAYMLDRSGVFSLGSDDLCKPISAAIQPAFRSSVGSPIEIDWSADTRLWHGSADLQWETIRWFVHVVGSDSLNTALCFNYRTGSWWIERYPWDVTSSALARIDGSYVVIAGSEARSVVGLWASDRGDMSPPTGTTVGTVSSATESTITDGFASFGPDLAGKTVIISHGTGEGQSRVISDATSDTITVVQAWAVTPDSTSEYSVGGVSWKWSTPWLRLSNEQSGNPRNLELVYAPTQGAFWIDTHTRFDGADPRSWCVNSTDDGVVVQSGSPKMRFGTQQRAYRPGYSLRRIEGHTDEQAYGDLFVAYSLSGVKSDEPITLRRMTIDGVEAAK